MISRGNPSSESLVLIQGARGTGRRSLARGLHARSARRGRPFLSFDCRERNPLELRRVFLGEFQEVSPGRYLKYLGLLEAVQDGTLYLEEVESLSLDMQKILSRVLDERRFSPLGSDSVLPFRGRLMASTVVDLEACVADQTIHQRFHEQISSHLVRLDRSPGYE